MNKRPDELPSWSLKRLIALEAWHENLADHEKAAAKSARDAARAKSKARQNGRVDIATRIITAIHIEGKTVVEVATDLGWTLRNLRLRASALGIPLEHRSGQRRAPAIWLDDVTYAALARVAEDLRASLPETLETVLRFHFEDDGKAARRALRLPPRPAAEPTEVVAA